MDANHTVEMILKNPLVVLAEGQKPLKNRSLYKECLKGFLIAGALYVGLGSGFLLISDWKRSEQVAQVQQKMGHAQSSQTQLKTAMDQLRDPKTILAGAQGALMFAIDSGRPEFIMLASQRLVDEQNMKAMELFEKDLLNSSLFQNNSVFDRWRHSQEEIDGMTKPLNTALRQSIRMAVLSDSREFMSWVQRAKKDKIVDLSLEKQHQFWSIALEHWIHAPYWDNQSYLFLNLQEQRVFADLNQDYKEESLKDVRVIRAVVQDWFEKKKQLGFNPAQIWVLWRLESVFGPQQNIHFHPEMSNELKKEWWTWQKRIHSIKTTEDLTALLVSMQESNDFWISTIKLDDGFQKMLWDPEQHPYIPDSMEEVLSSILSEAHMLPGKMLLGDPMTERGSIEEVLRETGVSSLTIPWYAQKIPRYEKVVVQFLTDSNEGLRQVTQWEGPVLGLNQSVHFRWMPPRQKEWNGGYFFRHTQTNQLFIQTQVSQASFGPIFHEWFHALDSKLASPGEHFASQDTFFSTMLSHRLEAMNHHPLGWLILPRAGLMQLEDSIQKNAGSFGEEKVLKLAEQMRHMPGNIEDQRNVYQEAQWRGMLGDETQNRWASMLQLSGEVESSMPIRTLWQLWWDRFLIERWARVENGNFMFRSIWFDKEEETLKWGEGEYWGTAHEIFARAFEGYSQSMVPADRFWRYEGSRSLEGFYSPVMPTPAEVEEMAPLMADFFKNLTPWWSVKTGQLPVLSRVNWHQKKQIPEADQVKMGQDIIRDSMPVRRSGLLRGPSS